MLSTKNKIKIRWHYFIVSQKEPPSLTHLLIYSFKKKSGTKGRVQSGELDRQVSALLEMEEDRQEN